jgi:hypothetical protein
VRKHSLIAVIALILSIINNPAARAETVTFSCGDGANYSVILPSGIATDGSKCSGPLVIDASVKVIGKNAFSFSKISSIKLPDSVVSIEAGGLAYLKLESIDLGRSIESLGFEAFRGTRVNSIKLPNSLKTIGESALADTSFAEISIPNSVTSIERTAFAREDSQIPLNSIVIPDSVKSLGFAAFVRSGLKSITIGKGLKAISASAFEGNRITEVTIPSNIMTIQAFAFRGNPLQRVNFGNSVEIIDSEAFARTQLTKLILPNSLTGIGTQAFANILTLKEVDFPDSFNPMFTASNVPTVGDIFEGSYSISRILYCGKATGFYVPPTCEGSRKVAYDSAISAESKVMDDEAVSRARAKSVFETEQQESIRQAIQLAAVSSKPISIKITSENPKCPNGFIQTQPSRQSNTPYGKVIICESIVKSPEERAAAERAAAERAAAEKAAADKPAVDKPAVDKPAVDKPAVDKPAVDKKAVKPVVKEKIIVCAKGKSSLKVIGKNPKCPVGYKKK